MLEVERFVGFLKDAKQKRVENIDWNISLYFS